MGMVTLLSQASKCEKTSKVILILSGLILFTANACIT